MDHPGLKEASSGGVGTGVNHTSLSPVNRAKVAVSAFRTALWCSLRRCVKVLPVCPMYVLGQFVQGIRYTTLRASTSSSFHPKPRNTVMNLSPASPYFLAPMLQSSPSSTIYHWPFSSPAPKTQYFSSLLPTSLAACSSRTVGRPVEEVSPAL